MAASGEAHPPVALAERGDIKARCVSGCHVGDLVLHASDDAVAELLTVAGAVSV